MPALPVDDTAPSVEFHRDKHGFTLADHDGASPSCAVMRSSFTSGPRPMRAGGPAATHHRGASGAESSIAGTAGCRVGIEGVDGLHRVIQLLGLLPPNAKAPGHAP